MTGREDRRPPGRRREEAAAVRYDPPADAAPRLVAKGRGETARKIIEVARAHGIPIREDPDLVALLGAVDLYDEIPERLFPAVAEVLAWVYRMNASYPASKSAGR